MVQNGNFNEISIKEARAICDNLQIGDIVVLDERMANTRYLNDKFFFTQISDEHEGNREFYTSGQYTRYISRVLPDRRTKVVNTSQKDCSIRIALDGDDEMWISYGCIDYLETKRINDDNKQPLLPPKEVVEATEEVDEVKEVKVLNNTNDESKKEADENQDSKLKRLKADNDVLRTSLELMEMENKRLEQEINDLKKREVLANADNVNSLIKTLIHKCSGGIKGTKWTKDEEIVVVVRADTDLYMIIDVKTFDRYYEEMLSEDQVIKELIARGWKLEENSLEKDK